MQRPKISVVTVCFNAESMIEKTMRSVLDQSMSGIEYVLVDGASTDRTLKIISSLSSEFPSKTVLVKSEFDHGIYDAMNKAIDMATGEWIFFLNVGDVFTTNTTLHEVFRSSNEGYSAIYTDVINCYEKDNIYVKADRPFFAPNHEYLNMGFGHQSVIVRTDLARKYHFDLSYRCCADYLMIKTIYNNGGKFLYIPIPMCKTENRFGFSNNRQLLQARELGIICGVEKTWRFKKYYILLALKAVVKKILKK